MSVRIEYNYGEQIGDAIFLYEVIAAVKRRQAKFRCSCGNEFIAEIRKIKSFEIKGCGCLRGKAASSRNHTTHGLRHHPLYSIWCTMKARCYNEKVKSYKNYGGRGVRVCDEWVDDFKSFYDWAISNGWEQGLQIDKEIKAKELGVQPLLYCPAQCTFVTAKQNSNNRRSNRIIEYKGQFKTGSEWADIYNIRVETIWTRLKRGWDVDKTFNTKVA